MQFIVTLESGVWLCDEDGDPGRTLVRESATRYARLSAATAALDAARACRDFPDATIEAASAAEGGEGES